MRDWNDVRRWRKEQRARLIDERRALPLAARQQRGEAIAARAAELDALNGAPCCVGFYWPIRGEPDLRPLVRSLLERGFTSALPVVVEKNAPVEFHRYTTSTRLTRQSVWGIPIPAEQDRVQPDVVLVPLVGMDDDCYRLGYGGGYYDRTLASLSPRPFAIGVGFELGRLDTIYPQPHDIPMDVLVTEERVLEREPA
jgi:5-formyltetrahydrofolate cyclo-ligase